MTKIEDPRVSATIGTSSSVSEIRAQELFLILGGKYKLPFYETNCNTSIVSSFRIRCI